MSNGGMTNELERIWKEVVVAYSRLYSGYLSKGKEQNNKKASLGIAGAPIKI
jgi:hypothetical protein